MPPSCLACYITDRTAFAGDEPARRKRLLEKIAEAARAGVDYIQIREKNLTSRELESLAGQAVGIIRDANKLRTQSRDRRTALLINSRTDIALAVGADGVHLRSDDISPLQVRTIWQRAAPCGAGTPSRAPLIGVSCHSPEQVQAAAAAGATFAVFAPVFEKKDSPDGQPAGLAQLERACRGSIPVLALGGINLENAEACLRAGAAGIAAIRLFQKNEIAAIVARLRA